MNLKNGKLEKKDEMIDLELEELDLVEEETSIELKTSVENKIETLNLEPKTINRKSSVEYNKNDDVEELSYDNYSNNINNTDNYNSNPNIENTSNNNSNIQEDNNRFKSSNNEKINNDREGTYGSENKDSMQNYNKSKRNDLNNKKDQQDNKTDKNKENNKLRNKNDKDNKIDKNKEVPKDKSAIDKKREQAKQKNESNKRKKPNKANKGSNLKDRLKNKAKNKAKNMAKNAANNAKNKSLDSFNNSGLGQTINNVKDKVNKAKKAANAAKKTAKAAAKAAKLTVSAIKLIIQGLIAAWPVVVGVLCVIIIVVCVMAIVGVDANAGTYSGYSDYTGGYYCTNITVEGKSYPLEEYVARVIAQELGMADAEGLKAQAVLARTFVIKKTSGGKCTISNSQNEQTLKTGDIAQKYYDAAKATEGVILTSGGKITGAYYATFPTGVEGSQDWGEGGCGPITCDDNGNCTTKFYKYPSKTPWDFTMPEKDSSGNYWNGSSLTNQSGHCHGVSQLGILYYEEQGKKYDEILKIFYDSGVELSKLPASSQQGTAIVYNGSGSYKKSTYYYNQVDYNTTGYCGRTPAAPGSGEKYLYYYNCKANTICSSGCGGTSLAMIVASIKQDSSITPVSIMSSIQERGGCGVGISGSRIDPIVRAAKEVYGLTAYHTGDETDVATKLASGDYLVIANVTVSEFTGGGHYIVLSGYENGQVHVLDPWGGAKTDMSNSILINSRITGRQRNGWWPESAVFDYSPNGYIVIGEKTE